MTLRHIKIFLALCDHGCSATRAAEALRMTQPAVSLALRELEQYYGVVLFDRMGRRLHITEAGRQFQRYAAGIDALLDDLETSLKNWDSFGLLRVGASITIGTHFLAGYISAFHARCPGTQVRACVETSERIERRVLENDLDLGLIEGAAHDPALVSQVYMDDRLAVLAPAGGPYRSGQCLTREAFQRERFLLRERGSGTREEFERALEGAGLSVTPSWESMSNTALINAAASGLGLAVLSRRIALDALRAGRVVEIFVEGLKFRRCFRIIYHENKFLTTSAKTFLDICRSGGM